MYTYLLVVVFLCGLSFNVKAENPNEILSDKRLVSTGQCVFKGKDFQVFAQNVIAPKGKFTLVPCALFAKDRSMNPTWVVIVDKEQTIREIIRWSDPATFESLYTLSLEDSI